MSDRWIGPAKEDTAIPFTIWPKDASEADAREIHAWTAKHAAEKRAKEDWIREAQSDWPITYCVRDGVNGTIWIVDVAIASQPTFVAIDAQEMEMPEGTHVLWGGRVLCEDLRLRDVPRDWPAGQCWISLKDVADGAEAPANRCERCWAKAPSFIAGLRQIGSMKESR